ncbi:hypothetical protein [uncultured Desulfosarcina sp.]|uniref:hypothetical protein n=1 Tax=uncultured Desulfosarcina sp. TaxID=218289 RepID=UPI0029C7EE5E|nr:hypothetical protein [uncultured Desulfosarcina sp.]
MEKGSFLSIVFVIVFSAMAISSCRTGLSVQAPATNLDMKTQSIDSEHGYSAIGVWSLFIEDQTGTFDGYSIVFSIGPIGAANILCNYLKTGQTNQMSPAEAISKYAKVKPVNGSWKKSAEKNLYDGLFVVELLPGDREFFHLRLENQNQNSENWLSEQWLSIPLYAPCKVEANKIYDLQHLEIVITEKIKGKDGKFFFNYEVRSSNKGNTNHILLNRHYPQLNISEYDLVQDCMFRGPETICK